MNLSRSTLSVLITLLFSQSVSAVSWYDEQGKLIRAPRAMGVLGDNLFGDEVNYYNGSLSFSQTDVSLPGNNSLPMTITRSFTAGGRIETVGHFGHWELEIPRMHGKFAVRSSQYVVGGWVVPKYSWVPSMHNRCSSFGAPPDAMAAFNGLAPFSPDEFWQGNHLAIPGLGSQEVVLRTGYNPQTGSNGAGANMNYPVDGYQYPLVTKNLWAIRCLPTLANGEGEGFLAVSPDGTQYKFDWMVSRSIDNMTKGATESQGLTAGLGATKPANSVTNSITPDLTNASASIPLPDDDVPAETSPDNNILPRQEVWILPTLVTDRFGNTIRYVWDTQDKWKLLQMVASDGRKLDFTYQPGTSLISSITDGTRTWRYNYTNIGSTQAPVYTLGEVVNPDQSRWQLAGIEGLARSLSYSVSSPGCDGFNSATTGNLTGSMTHPSGAVGTFTLSPVLHGRTGIERDCRITQVPGIGPQEVGFKPRYFNTNSLVQKNLSGPGLPSMNWSVTYGPANAGWDTCTNCVETKTVLVTDPNGDNTRYTFGNRYNVNEGLLLQTDYGFNGSTAQRSVVQKYRAINTGPYVNPVGYSEQTRGDAEMSARLMPVEQRTTTQQGVTFTWQADPNSFDTKARPTIITKSSTLGYSRSEQTVYADFAAKWVLGQIDSVTERNTGLVMTSNTFDSTTANITSTSQFGHLTQSMTYNTDGTLATRKDGKNQTTTFSNYKRGLAQNVTYPDTTSESAVVNDIGLITSTTDANSYTTSYDYDAAGRLKVINYPAGDSVSWAPTTLSYEQVGADEFGLAAGHWRETVTTGNAKAITWLDAFWRPVLTSTFDAANEAATRRMVLKRYDYRSKPTFESYPQRSISSINDSLSGTTNWYDALARLTSTIANSELGSLSTTISYGSGFKKTVTNPRGYATTSSFQAFDEASESALVRVEQPMGISINIQRDVFGKPLAVTRSGLNSSFTRNYVYDAKQRLCKTIDPEIGTTKQQWDDANNLIWRAIGVTGNSLTECYLDYATAAEKISYQYDTLNRLTTTTYGDGSPSITRTYTPDGLPNTISSDGAVWTNSYNRRRLNESESLSYANTSYTIGHHYDTNGSLAGITYPDNARVDYAPNALGEPGKVGPYASNISFHPNGALAGFTYGNGIVHSMQQNLRNLPAISQDGAILKDQYSYDANGNVSAIGDVLTPDYNRSMSYDELDRLTGATALGIWGTASYTYDPQDNMTKSTVGTRTINHVFDSTNRLASINSSTAGYTLSYSYDKQGNLTMRGSQGFVFDQGNRLRSATGKASYNYDGLGRRVKIANTDGSTRIQVYSAAGQLLYATQSGGSSPASSTKYIYLRHGMIAEVTK